LEQVLVVDPVFCTNFRNMKGCFSYIGNMLDLTPTNPAYVDSLGNLTSNPGMASLAIDWLLVTQFVGFILFLWGLFYGFGLIFSLFRNP